MPARLAGRGISHILCRSWMSFVSCICLAPATSHHVVDVLSRARAGEVGAVGLAFLVPLGPVGGVFRSQMLLATAGVLLLLTAVLQNRRCAWEQWWALHGSYKMHWPTTTAVFKSGDGYCNDSFGLKRLTSFSVQIRSQEGRSSKDERREKIFSGHFCLFRIALCIWKKEKF